MHTRPPPDDLLELGHGADLAVEHDEPAGLHIDTGLRYLPAVRASLAKLLIYGLFQKG